jgi:hypothetical protein
MSKGRPSNLAVAAGYKAGPLGSITQPAIVGRASFSVIVAFDAPQETARVRPVLSLPLSGSHLRPRAATVLSLAATLYALECARVH